MRRRLLLSYLGLTAVVLLLLELPLGALEARQERSALAANARREATAVAVLAAEGLDDPPRYDLTALASRYRAQAGSEVAIMDRKGQVLVALDPNEALDGSAELAPALRRALDGEILTVRRRDEGRTQLAAVLPVRYEGKVVGAVAVSIPATATENRIRRAWLALSALAVVLMVVVCALGLLLARSLTAPLTRLQGAAERLGRGDLFARAAPGGPRELAAVATEFNHMADQLAGTLEGQRRFVADASHQLRTPLTALRLRIENLTATTEADDANDDLAGCQSEVDRMARLVDGLLALSRAEHTDAVATPTDVGQMASDRSHAWSALAEERAVLLRSVVAPGPRPAVALIDPEHLEQVIDNLLANAVEASPSGSTISLGVQRSPGVVTLEVVDQGPGMDEADQERAFDRFWQGANGATGSSGLGLAIVHELVTRARGAVTLGSPDGGGLRVTVSLPTADAR